MAYRKGVCYVIIRHIVLTYIVRVLIMFSIRISLLQRCHMDKYSS